MNKGKETYTNISIPDGLSSAVEDGIRRGKRQLEKKWFTAFGTLAAACVLGVVLFRVVSDNSVRTPLENGPATARISSEPEGGSPDDQAPAGAQTMMVSGNDIAASDAANETETPEGLQRFNRLGYLFRPEYSDAARYVFTAPKANRTF